MGCQGAVFCEGSPDTTVAITAQAVSYHRTEVFPGADMPSCLVCAFWVDKWMSPQYVVVSGFVPVPKGHPEAITTPPPDGR